jgi:hypothetical protein
MAVAALNEPLVHAMAIRFCEVRFGRGVASITEIRLCPDQEMFRFFGIVDGMAVQTTDVVAGMDRTSEMPLRACFPVATQAPGTRLLSRQRLETDDLANVSSAPDVL